MSILRGWIRYLSGDLSIFFGSWDDLTVEMTVL
jgi:hypothetical protein